MTRTKQQPLSHGPLFDTIPHVKFKGILRVERILLISLLVIYMYIVWIFYALRVSAFHVTLKPCAWSKSWILDAIYAIKIDDEHWLRQYPLPKDTRVKIYKYVTFFYIKQNLAHTLSLTGSQNLRPLPIKLTQWNLVRSIYRVVHSYEGKMYKSVKCELGKLLFLNLSLQTFSASLGRMRGHTYGFFKGC